MAKRMDDESLYFHLFSNLDLNLARDLNDPLVRNIILENREAFILSASKSTEVGLVMSIVKQLPWWKESEPKK